VQLSPELQIIHQPIRLKLVALLYQHGDLSATAAVQSLGTTSGNLDAHARKLVENDVIVMRRTLTTSGFESRLELSRRGIQLFEQYLQVMRAFLRGVEGPL
jgi:DNA-binding MarR family transcriptional regulator